MASRKAKEKEERFTALLHHISADLLRQAFSMSLRRRAAPGVDGLTWKDYRAELEHASSKTCKRKSEKGSVPGATEPAGLCPQAGRPRSVRLWSRPSKTRLVLGLDPRIVQRATATLLNAASHEEDFLGFSYGFRPGGARMMRWMRSWSGSTAER